MHATATLLLLTGLTGPAPESVEALPSPRSLPRVVQKVELPPGIGFYRPSAYDVWQLYGVGRTGTFLPRVRTTADTAFYQYDGSIYWWTTTRPMDRVTDFTR